MLFCLHVHVHVETCRNFLPVLASTGRKAGGCHCHFRVTIDWRAFLIGSNESSFGTASVVQFLGYKKKVHVHGKVHKGN